MAFGNFENIETINDYFGKNQLLDQDVLNAWSSLWLVRLDKETKEYKGFDQLTPMPHYEDYYEKNNSSEFADRIMQFSSPEQVAKYDKLVDEFNTSIEHLKSEKDYFTVRRFAQRAEQIIREDKK